MALKNQQKIDKNRDWHPIGTQVSTSGPKVIQKCSKGVPKVLKKLSKSDPKRSQLANIVFCRSWKHPVTKGAGGSGRSPLIKYWDPFHWIRMKKLVWMLEKSRRVHGILN